MKIADVVNRLRRYGTDTLRVEVKTAAGGLPRSVASTISAFANGAGGMLILGLSEKEGFKPAAGFDAKRIQDALARLCSDEMEPPLRSAIDIVDFEGVQVVVLDVAPLDPLRRPSYVKQQGPLDGSFIRECDGDRHLTDYEVLQLLSNHGQPTDDSELVAKADLDDLDPQRVERLVQRLRKQSPRAFEGLAPFGVLVRVGAAAQTSDGSIHPTLAGLLCLGRYPQQFFPQLFISFVALPGLTLGDSLMDGTRFLDNVSCDGPIPDMIETAVAAARRNMRTAAVIQEIGRADRLDYPIEVVRELVVNAVLHRDYSPLSRGTQIQIELYPDRLMVKSPGGLFGSVVPTQLGVEDVSSTRNAILARLLADVTGDDGQPISENRGSGLPRVFSRLRQAGMSPPTFEVTPGHVHVTVPQHALLDPATVAWIGSISTTGLSKSQHLALAIMRSTGSVTNAMLRTWGVERHEATQALRGLVDRELAVKVGGRRYAVYELTAAADPILMQSNEKPKVLLKNDDSRSAFIGKQLDAIVQAIAEGHDSSAAIAEHMGLTAVAVRRRLKQLLDEDRIVPTAPVHSPTRRYRVVL